MIKRLTPILLLSYVALHSLNVKAQDDISSVKLLGEIQYLITNKQYSKAYKQSQKYYKYIGEPDFDYLLG
ncbi:hypothetical protein V6248_20060, partial [Pseudoalteromonas agarivorans]